jgi:uncharacterized membrane protein YidH (DUF202 family)
MFSSADDMSKFMIAQLQDGRYGGQRILTEEAARTLHTIQWRGHRDGPGIALAFYQGVGNGRFVLTHGGDLACQHSDLWLVPDQQLGVFLIFNSTGTDWTRIRGSIWKAFIDRYLPAEAPALPPLKADKSQVAGSYVTTRRSQTNFLSLASFLQPTRVKANLDGSISMDGATDYHGAPKKYFPVGDLLFRESDGHTLGFIRGDHGRIVAMIADGVGEFEVEQGIVGGRMQAVLLILAVVTVILALLMWPIGSFARWRYERPLREDLDPAALRRTWLVRATVLVAIAMIILAGIYLAVLAKLEFQVLSASTDPYIRVFQVLAVLLIIGSAHALWRAALAWKRREGALSHRLGATVTACALAVLSSFMLSYHILALRLAY